MQDLLKRLDIENATIGHLNSTLQRIDRSPEDFPEGEELGPLAYEVSQTMKKSAIAVQSKGFTPTSTKSKAPQPKVIEGNPPVQPEAPIVSEVDLTGQIDWASLSPDQLVQMEKDLSDRIAREEAIANGRALQKRLLELQGKNAAVEGESLELDTQLLDQKAELEKARTLLAVRRQSEDTILSLTREAAIEMANDNVGRSIAAIDLGKSVVKRTLLPVELGVRRAMQRQSEMNNSGAEISARTMPLLNGGFEQKEMQTIDL
jgi:hypothetical protein